MKYLNLKKIILSILLISFCFVSKAQENYKIAEQDSLALLAFYWATDGPNWSSNQDNFDINSLSSEWQGIYNGGFNKWLDGPVKNWFGVTVKKFPVPASTDSVYRVVKLWPVLGRRTDGQNRMKGFIPKEIGLLTQLRDFRINGNDGFSDTEIPDELYHKTLEYIDIESCYFKGDICEKFRTCTNIMKMNFRYNKIDYMPTLDFLTASALSNLNGIQWFYSTQLSLAIFEKSINYFYTISENPKEFPLEMRDVNNVGDEKEIVASLGSAVDLVCNEAGEKEQFITYQWFRNGMSRIGRTRKNYSIANIQATDYGKYKVRITNDYVKAYDQNSNWGEIFTKEISLVAQPVAPVVLWAKTSYNGQSIQLRMSKTMGNTISDFDKLEVKADDKKINILNVIATGRLKRDLIVTLSEPIIANQIVRLSLTSPGIVCENGGATQPFADSIVQNVVKPKLTCLHASTSKDGAYIEVTFSHFINPNALSISDFVISGSKNYSIKSIALKTGVYDASISKTIRIVLNEAVENSEEQIKLSYTTGTLSGLYAGAVLKFENMSVENNVVLEKNDVKLTFVDGSKKLSSLILNGSWLTEAVQLFDDGTNGDIVSGDNVWTRTFSLADDTYTWNIYSRKTEIKRDTIKSIDPVTGIETLTIIPKSVHTDSLINLKRNLNFTLEGDKITGDTIFEINNKTVVFNVTVPQSTSQVYLMGINEDWGLGYLMDSEGSYFVKTLRGYTTGDIITYNYRNGNVWENETPDSRKYIVTDGDNIIYDVFGIFSSISTPSINQNDYRVFYNNQSQQIEIKGFMGALNYKVIELSGKIVSAGSLNQENDKNIQLSQIPVGMYFILLTTPNGDFVKTQKIRISY